MKIYRIFRNYLEQKKPLGSIHLLVFRRISNDCKHRQLHIGLSSISSELADLKCDFLDMFGSFCFCNK